MAADRKTEENIRREIRRLRKRGKLKDARRLERRRRELEAAAVVERKAAVKGKTPRVAARPLVVVGEPVEERWHYVDGERVRRLDA